MCNPRIELTFLMVALCFISFAMPLEPAHSQTKASQCLQIHTLSNDSECDQSQPIRFQASNSMIEVVDGDTLWIGNVQIRLHGIDALESDQNCKLAGEEKHCGEAARLALKEFAIREGFYCTSLFGKNGRPRMNHNRYISICHVGGIEVNRALVADGWALASEKPRIIDYLKDEDEARKTNLGMHAMEYTAPWIHRKDKRGNRCECDEGEEENSEN